MKKLLISFTTLLISVPAMAGWQLTGDSSLHFLSTKKTNITEIHEFTGVEGTIDDSGKAQFDIDLSSVETGIPIRNERMQKLLFETTQFARATVTTEIPAPLMDAVKAGSITETDLDLVLGLHGISKTLSATVLISQSENGEIVVSTTVPVLIKAADFGLEGGIEALRSVAALDSISTTVPVMFNLVFTES